MRAAGVSAQVCVASWLGLLVGAGNSGLQRSVAVSPLTLLEAPLALALASGLALVLAWLPVRLGWATALPADVVAGVLVGDLFGAAVLAPVLVGELELIHAPIVFVAITALGLQPLAAFAGAWFATRSQTRRGSQRVVPSGSWHARLACCSQSRSRRE